MSSHQSCKNCWERQNELLESGDGSQVICHCLDGLTDEEIANEVTALVLSEIEEAFPAGEGQLDDDETRLMINENGSNSSQLEEVFAGSSQCQTDEISLPRTTPKTTTPKTTTAKTTPKTTTPKTTNKNAHSRTSSKKRKVSDSFKLASSNVETKLKKRLFHEPFPTDEEFTKCERSMNIMKWRNMPLNKIYRLLSLEIKGSSENPYMATMKSKDGSIFKVWIRARIYDQLKIYDMEKECVYIKSYGLKACKGDPSKHYFDFSVIVKEQ